MAVYGNKVTSAILSSSSSLSATITINNTKYGFANLTSVSTLVLLRTSTMIIDFAALGFSSQQTYTINLGQGFVVDSNDSSYVSPAQTITFNTYPTITNFFPTNGSRVNTYFSIYFDRPITFTGQIYLYQANGTLLQTYDSANSTNWSYLTSGGLNYGIKFSAINLLKAATQYYVLSSSNNWIQDQYKFYGFPITSSNQYNWTTASEPSFPDLVSFETVTSNITINPLYARTIGNTTLSSSSTSTINAGMIHHEHIRLQSNTSISAEYKSLFLPRVILTSTFSITAKLSANYRSTVVYMSATSTINPSLAYKPIIPTLIGTIVDPNPGFGSTFGSVTKLSQNYILIGTTGETGYNGQPAGQLYLYTTRTDTSTPFGTLIHKFDSSITTNAPFDAGVFDMNNQYIILGGGYTENTVYPGAVQTFLPSQVLVYNISTMISNINNNIPIDSNSATYTLPPASRVFASNGYFILVRDQKSKQSSYLGIGYGSSTPYPTTLEIYNQNTGNLVNTINLPTVVTSYYDSLQGETIYSYQDPIVSYEVTNDSITMLSTMNVDANINHPTVYFINNVATDSTATIINTYTLENDSHNLVSSNGHLTLIANGNQNTGFFGAMDIYPRTDSYYQAEINSGSSSYGFGWYLSNKFSQLSTQNGAYYPQLGDAVILSNDLIIMGVTNSNSNSSAGIIPQFILSQPNTTNISIKSGIAIYYNVTNSFISFIGGNSDGTNASGVTGTSVSKWNDGSNGNFAVSTTYGYVYGKSNFVSIYNIKL